MTDSDPADALSARIQRSIGEDTPVGLLTIVQATNVDAADRLADMMRPVAAASRGEPGNLLSTIGRGDDGLTFDLHDRWSIPCPRCRNTSAPIISAQPSSNSAV